MFIGRMHTSSAPLVKPPLPPLPPTVGRIDNADNYPRLRSSVYAPTTAAAAEASADTTASSDGGNVPSLQPSEPTSSDDLSLTCSSSSSSSLSGSDEDVDVVTMREKRKLLVEFSRISYRAGDE